MRAYLGFTLSAVLGLVGPAFAAAPYVASYSSQAYQATGGGTVLAPTAYAFGYDPWDEGAAEVALPFAFEWYGRSYSTAWVFTNGLLSFDPPPSAGGLLGQPSMVPNPAGRQKNYIAPLWADLTGLDRNGNVQGELRAVIIGAAPNRSLILQFRGLRASQNPTSTFEAQVWLEEGSSAVTVHYGPSTGISSATAAVEDASGQQGGALLAGAMNCGGCSACAPRTCNSANVPAGTHVRLDRPPNAELLGSIEGPRGAYPGTSFTATVTVANLGLAPTAAFDVEIRLSEDAAIDASDRLLSTRRFPIGLDIGTSSTAAVQLGMPLGIATRGYFLGMMIDPQNTVSEANEANNTAYDAHGIVSGPDLTATLSTPLASGPGETMVVMLELVSVGAPVRGPIEVALHLSTDATLDAGDTRLLTRSFTLPDGFRLATPVSVTIPANARPSPPPYRVLVEVDSNRRVDETNEANNVVAAPETLVLSAPDLNARSFTSGANAFRGRPYPMTAMVGNIGGTRARDFTVCAIMSTDAVITLADTVLARTASITLDAGRAAMIRLEPRIPMGAAPGGYYFALMADCDGRISENDESNNVARSMAAIPVGDPMADLSAVSIATATTAAAGESLAVSVIVGNLGPLEGAAIVRVVLSDNPGITTMDLTLWETPAPVRVGANQEVTVSAWVPIPGDTPSGNYHLGAIIDPDERLAELREDNNAIGVGPVPLIGADLAIISPDPPNAVIDVPYVWRFFAVGGTGRYTWSGAWTGVAPAGLSFDAANGELRGTPTMAAEGAHELTVRAESGGAAAARKFRVLVGPPTLPLTIVSSKLPPALDREGYSVRLVAVGGVPPYTWSKAMGAVLPPGILMNEQGVVGGEPRGVGAYTFEVLVADAEGTVDSAIIALDVIDPAAGVSIATVDLPSGTVGRPYKVDLEVRGGTAPYQWRLIGDSAPGIRFEGGDKGRFVGTGTIAGSFPIVVEVRDKHGLLDRNAYVLEVHEAGDLEILYGDGSEPLPRAFLEKPYRAAMDAPVLLRVERRSGATSGLSTVRWSVPLGELPPGLGLDPVSGVIDGVPTREGAFAFTAFVRDDRGDFDRATFAILVEKPLVIGGPGNTESCGCRASRGGGAGWLLFALLALRRRRA